MGRRKIEIQPITHERNRSVTFLKRKNGLFKKAYELGVLCSVDVVVIIFDEKPGQPGTQKLYEYGSSKIRDIVKKHSKYTGERDSKGPNDFSRGGGKGGGGKIDEDLDADGDEDDEDDEEEEEEQPAPPPKKRQKKSGTKTAATTSTKHTQSSASLKRQRSPTPTTSPSRTTTPDLRPSEPSSAMPSGYLQHQSQTHVPQYNHQHSNSPSSPFDPYHPQIQYHQQGGYQPQLSLQQRPLQQGQFPLPPPYGGKYPNQNQLYGPSYRHLFDNQNPNPNIYTSSSFNDLLSIFEAMPSNANAHSNGLSLPGGGGLGMENMAGAWPEHPSLYLQQRGGGSGSGSAGSNNWLDHLSGSGGQGRRPTVGEELIGVFQGGAARRGQPSTPDEEDEGGRSGSTSDSEYKPQPSRRRGKGKKG